MTAAAVTFAAPAKINLALHVRGRRDDGYHLLESLVVFAGVGDRVTATPADALSLDITGPFAAGLAGESDNLVLKAARWLAQALSRTGGAHLTLEKNLPVASGIGGGSADAAAALKACAALWGADVARLDPRAVARLGADVPVCLAGRASVMRGIGEDVAPTPPLPEAWLVLVNPGVPLATKAVFGALRGRFGGALEPLSAFAGFEAFSAYLDRQRNDLATPAGELLPVIGEVLTALEGLPGCRIARLSGSGATCFGLFSGEDAAHAAAKGLKSRRPSWWVAPAPVLP